MPPPQPPSVSNELVAASHIGRLVVAAGGRPDTTFRHISARHHGGDALRCGNSGATEVADKVVLVAVTRVAPRNVAGFWWQFHVVAWVSDPGTQA